MKKFAVSLVLGAFLLGTTVSLAATSERNLSNIPKSYFNLEGETYSQENLEIEKGVLVLVQRYVEDSDTYSLRILSDVDIGPNIVTREKLAQVAGFGKIRNSSKLVGKKILLKKKVELIGRDRLQTRSDRVKDSLPTTPNYRSAKTIAKLRLVTIDHYDAASKVYHVREYGKRSSYTRYTPLEELAVSVRVVKKRIADLRMKPKLLIGKKLRLSRRLQLISQEEVDQREDFFYTNEVLEPLASND